MLLLSSCVKLILISIVCDFVKCFNKYIILYNKFLSRRIDDQISSRKDYRSSSGLFSSRRYTNRWVRFDWLIFIMIFRLIFRNMPPIKRTNSQNSLYDITLINTTSNDTTNQVYNLIKFLFTNIGFFFFFFCTEFIWS
jgi:hypothetical protein